MIEISSYHIKSYKSNQTCISCKLFRPQAAPASPVTSLRKSTNCWWNAGTVLSDEWWVRKLNPLNLNLPGSTSSSRFAALHLWLFAQKIWLNMRLNAILAGSSQNKPTAAWYSATPHFRRAPKRFDQLSVSPLATMSEIIWCFAMWNGQFGP